MRRTWSEAGRSLIVAALALSGVAVSFVACGDSGEDTLCNPGTEVFCLCRGGQVQGTQTCSDDGMSLGECTTPDGTCPTIEDPSTSTSSGICTPTEVIACTCDDGTDGTKTCNDDGQSFTDCTTPMGVCGSGMGTKLLFEACADGGECTTGVCKGGYCTRSCTTYQDCLDPDHMIGGDCVPLGGENTCAPYCIGQDDCAGYGPNTVCGGATALDDPNIFFAACGEWGDAVGGMPYGTLCDENTGEVLYVDQLIVMECDLGLGTQDVCTFGVCSKGCYEDADCPTSTAGECSSVNGVIGCCASDPECN